MSQTAPMASPAAMTDIVERLRAYWPDGPGHQIAWEAAAEIERLHKENDIMRRHLNLHPDKPLGNELRAEIERLTAHVKALSRTLNGIANREDFADKVIAVADKARALEPKP